MAPAWQKRVTLSGMPSQRLEECNRVGYRRTVVVVRVEVGEGQRCRQQAR